MKKEALSFLHDSDASDDPKLIRLRIKIGWDAIGIYWSLVEKMRASKDYKLKLCDCDVIAVRLQPLNLNLRELVDACINSDINLFASDGEYFWSNSLLERMDKYNEWKKKKSEAGIKGNEIRWGKKRRNIAQGSQCDRSVVAANRIEDNKTKQNIKEDNKRKLKELFNSEVYINVADKVIEYLNQKTGKDFALIVGNVSDIVERQQEGMKLNQFVKVIDVKIKDPHFIKNPQFMNPNTLFRQPNFDKYRNQEIEDFKPNQPKPRGL